MVSVLRQERYDKWLVLRYAKCLVLVSVLRERGMLSVFRQVTIPTQLSKIQ